MEPKKKKENGKKTTYNDKILALGNELLGLMPDSRRDSLGSLSHTLHFESLLGFNSIPSRRSIGGRGIKGTCATPVGITLRTDIDIEDVPVINVLLNNKTGISPAQINKRKVYATEEFSLTYYEFMFLIIRDCYAGFFTVEGEPKRGFVSFNFRAVENGNAKLPTPMIQIKRNRRERTEYEKLLKPITDNIEPIDELEPKQGMWKVKSAYAEKFGPLLEHLLKKREEGKKRIAQSMRELHLTSK